MQYEWVSLQIVGILVFAAVMTVIFVLVERRAADPIMPLGIYANRVVSISLVAVFITGFAMFGSIIFIPLFFQGVLGASATSSGSFMTPMMMSMVVAATLSGQALSRLGGHYRLQGLMGIGVMAGGTVLISRMTADTSFGQAVASIMVTGLGLGMTFPSFTIAVQNAAPMGQLGAVTSATQFYRSIGGALGLAVLGSFMANRFAAGLQEALPAAIRQAVPAEQLARMEENPQALVNPQALEALRAGICRTRSTRRRGSGPVAWHAAGDTGVGDWLGVRGGVGGAGDCLCGDDFSAGGSAARTGTRRRAWRNVGPNPNESLRVFAATG